MNIQPIKFAIASAITALIVWLLCSVMVWLHPQFMLSLSGDMFHANLAPMGWQLTISGVIKGAFAWMIFAAIFAWLLATFYNQLQQQKKA
ncbi:DUF5676 family membrane protein [Permianibacter aggregans]|uniref:Uncharacterized protein n=1 Tax=Permianibacter aggregans TaxID=1510150 RepID=A0A4R6UP08_9GAMM|nr:DUF5676 family membrane protein [Permianibacter aggregans]QGX38188.1 hypothetical protein E2H98_00275 [Permianibacter aggregans]TDQ44964.1 hypothetical protein EV696_12220 [Permianibacter aggregans]